MRSRVTQRWLDFLRSPSARSAELLASSACAAIGPTILSARFYHLSPFNHLLLGNLLLFGLLNTVFLALVAQLIERQLSTANRVVLFKCFGEPDPTALAVRWSRLHVGQLVAVPLSLIPSLNPWWLFGVSLASYLVILLVAAVFSIRVARLMSRVPQGTGRVSQDALDQPVQADAHLERCYGLDAGLRLFKQRMYGELRNVVCVNGQEVTLRLPTPVTSHRIQLGVVSPPGSSGGGELTARLDDTVVLRKPLSLVTGTWHDFLDLPNGTEAQTASTIRLSGTGKTPVYVSVHIAVPAARPRNIIVIILDGLRKDAVGLYSGKAQATPAIDRFFGPYARYERAYVQAEWTMPSFASMATSLYSSHHKVVNPQYRKARTLPSHVETMAEALQRHGYYTFAYLSHARTSHLYGHHRGYHRFLFPSQRTRHQDITCKALEILQAHEQEQTFLFLHYFDLHSPLQPGSPFFWSGAALMTRSDGEILRQAEAGGRAEQEEFLATMYANKLREVDCFLDLLFSSLERTPLRDTTAVILTSDHGTSLPADGVEGWTGKHFSEERLGVPLLVRCPWRPETHGKTYRELVESCIDLYPTVAELAGVQATTSPYSQSFLPDAQGRLRGKEHAITEMLFRGRYKCRVFDGTYEYLRSFNWITGELTETVQSAPSNPSDPSALERFRRLTVERKLFQPGDDVDAYY